MRMYIPINHSTLGVAAIDTQNTLIREVHLLIGIITDCRGSWIVDFTRKNGICVYLGIKLTWERGFRKIIFESDSRVVIEKCSRRPSFRSLVQRMRE